ncbi:N-acetylmuramoyl-L-alanine amidase [Priestia aryabhattai]|uniref:N-acetylmuramoyl-L-alanine amidase n=1 Tax=Priestia aryabhattai TaxID=412384 RepID=UPI002E232887|nr:N-acetylmuramoyl-L-alanine amidase [Priestia aryabhattai]
MFIMLDPGHGGDDPGAIYNGLQEKDITLYLSLRLKEVLEADYNIKTLITRSSDSYIALSERAYMANHANVDCFISLHNNAGKGTGFESYIYPGLQGTRTNNMQNIIHETVMNFYKEYELRDRGKKEASFQVLKETFMPAILLENLFVDHTYDNSLLRDNSFLNSLAKAIALGISKFS